MALDRVYTLLPDGPRIWAQHRPDSPIAALARPLAIEGDQGAPAASQGVTVRVRYRGDIGPGTLLRDAHGATWHVDQVMEYMRHRWLDLNLSTYRQPATADYIPAAPGAVAPAGWLYVVDGRPWLSLAIDTVSPTNEQDRRGTFAIPEGLTGGIEYSHRADVWYFALAGSQLRGCFELVAQDNIRQGFLRLRFMDDGIVVPNSVVRFGTGDILELAEGPA